MIVTIDGLPGSGNTTATKKVAEVLNFKVITTGEIFKQMALEKGIQPGQLSEFWAKEGQDKELHNKLDQMQIDKATEAKEKGENVIFNGKLAAFHLRDIADLKIFLVASLDVRAKRNSGRDNVPFEQTKEEIQKRVAQETRNWREIYNFNYIEDTQYYDFILSTEKLDKEGVLNVVKAIIENWRK